MNEQMISLVSAGTSIVAAIVSGLLSVRSLRTQDRANRVQASGGRNQYFAELRRRADEACVALSEAAHLRDLDPSKTRDPNFFERRHRLQIQLPALIDRGRWFFPNHPIEGVGTDKGIAYQGYRHEVLDCLVAAYRIVDRFDHHQASDNPGKNRLDDVRKAFVSQIRGVLDPRSRAEEFERVMSVERGRRAG